MATSPLPSDVDTRGRWNILMILLMADPHVHAHGCGHSQCGEISVCSVRFNLISSLLICHSNIIQFHSFPRGSPVLSQIDCVVVYHSLVCACERTVSNSPAQLRPVTCSDPALQSLLRHTSLVVIGISLFVYRTLEGLAPLSTIHHQYGSRLHLSPNTNI